MNCSNCGVEISEQMSKGFTDIIYCIHCNDKLDFYNECCLKCGGTSEKDE